MSEFRNIQNNGRWFRGGTYTFEAYLPYWGGWAIRDEFITDRFLEAYPELYDQDGNLLFLGNNFIKGTQLQRYEKTGWPYEETKDIGWFRLTIKIPENAPLGSATIRTQRVIIGKGGIIY